MVHRVVQEVPAERLDRERGAVAASARPQPLVPADGREPIRQRRARRGQLGPYRARILLPVPVRDRGLVLVPVREQRVVLRQHQLQPVVI